MKSKVVLSFALAAGCVLIALRSAHLRSGKKPSSSAPPSRLWPEPGSTEPRRANVAAPAATVTNRLALPKPQEELWAGPVSEPIFAEFETWTDRFRQAPSTEAKAALEAEGVRLARVRLTAMADLIQADPERALVLAVPAGVRDALPESVKALLEEAVNVRGDYQVLGVLPPPGGGHALPAVVRAALVNGESYEVFTYGRALGWATRPNVPLNGVAVDLSAAPAPPTHPLLQRRKLMALSPTPARVLDRSELSAVLKAEPICSISGKPTETAVELGGVIQAFCGHVHAEDWINAGLAASGLETPSGVSPGSLLTAESSYTQGRKRMLLMRPIWSDYSSGMATNDALTHFQNFSNYMFEMSYGQLVLAALGKGSDITPSMLLPGLVADYDNTGLGKLYSTAKSVASTNYGYDLGKYDFTYVCTAGRPAASYAGLGFVGGVGFHLANSYWGPATACHEFGHNLGLNHAHFWDTQSRSMIGDGHNVEYGDNNDPMGGGGSPNCYNSASKNFLGWIGTVDVADLNVSGSGYYRLYAFDLDNSVGLRGLRFARNSSQNYWVNFRQRKPAKKALLNGVQLLWTGHSGGSTLAGSYVLDVRLKGDADDNAIVIGRTFSDPGLGLHITPVGKGHTFPESMDVQVNIGSFPGNLPPLVACTADQTNAVAGQTITFTAAAADPNGDPLAYWWEFGDGDYSIDNSATTTHNFAINGAHAVRCTVSDMKGGIARDSVVVQIGSPTSFEISGRVFDAFGRPLPGIVVMADDAHFSVSEADGAYRIAGLSGADYKMDAFEPVSGALSFAHPFFSNPITVGPDASDRDFILGTNVPPTTLVGTGAVWKYLDNGTDQGTNWRLPDFEDGAWPAGPAQFGYGEGDEATTISFGADSNNKRITYYFRHAFTVADPAVLTNLVLSLLRDDGGIVYLNGVEVFRSNMPTGPITAATLAAATASDDGKTFFPARVRADLLHSGLNLLAVEIHQADPTSSDISFDLSLSAEVTTNVAPAALVYLTSPANRSVLFAPTNLTLAANALSKPATVTNVEFFADGAKIGQDSLAPYSLDWSNPTPGVHTVAVAATLSSALRLTSAPVSITVSAPTVFSVQLASPSPGSVFAVPANVTVRAVVAAGSAALNRVEFYADGSLVGADASPPFQAALVETIPGSRQLWAVAVDLSGNSVTSAPVNVTFGPPAVGTQFISFGEAWKYLDDGSNQGSLWTAPSFDDRAWLSGPARLGYGGDGEVTTISFGPNSNQRYPTTYFRKTFVVADLAAMGGLRLRLVRDDGAVVYLNGVEVFRDNLPAGPVSWNSLASVTINPPEETTPLEVNLGTSNLLAGTNLIAVELHQASTNSNDAGFDLAAVGLNATNPSAAIYLTEPADQVHVNAPAPIGLATFVPENEAGAPASVTYYANGAWVAPGAAARPFSATWSNAPVGLYQLVAVAAWASGRSLTSPPVNLSVVNPPPRIQPVAVSLLPAGATWKYWDNVAAVGAGWQSMSFDDSAWPAGPARFGWGLDGEKTRLTEGRVTHYFRRWFSFPNPALLAELDFQLARDDGAVVYLNGAEVFRSNMPDGEITAATLASTTVNPPDETTYIETPRLTAGSGLLAGSNLVAIELHQSSASSSDAGFDLQLLASGTTEERVFLSTPREGGMYDGASIVNFEAIAKGGGSATVTKIEFFANGLKLGEWTSAPWRLAWSNAPVGFYSLTARSTDSDGAIADSLPVHISVGHDLVTTTLIPVSSVWKYLANGSNQGTNWTRLSYDDSGWASGPARLGYGGDGEVTTVSYGGNSNNKFITTYFRRRFVVPGGAVFTNLNCRLLRDDGAVVWLNGRELFRSNMPATPIDYLTRAVSAVGGPDEQNFLVTSLPLANLLAGTNLLAVEVHQSDPASSDLSFNLELTGIGYEDELAPPLLAAVLVDGLLELRWPITAVGWRVYSAPALPAPFQAWTSSTPLVVNGQNLLTVAPDGASQFFRLGKP